jgi:hypothetical protein
MLLRGKDNVKLGILMGMETILLSIKVQMLEILGKIFLLIMVLEMETV